MRCVITVVGKDMVGILASVSGICKECNVNVTEVSQSILQDMFCMMMMADASKSNVDFPVFAEKLDTCRRLQEEGKELSDALHDAGIFTGTCARLITLGARTGRMEDVMAQIAALYQDEIDARLTHILSVLEPTLVIVLSLIVGVILFSVMLPLMGIMSGI